MRYYVRLYSFTLTSEGGWCESDSMLFVACLSVGQMFECQCKGQYTGTWDSIHHNLYSWSSLVMVVCSPVCYDDMSAPPVWVCSCVWGLWWCVIMDTSVIRKSLSVRSFWPAVRCVALSFVSQVTLVVLMSVCFTFVSRVAAMEQPVCSCFPLPVSWKCVTPSWSPGFTYLPKACG